MLDSFRMLLLGKSGSGKSWLGRWLYLAFLDKKRYLVVLDVKSGHFYPQRSEKEFSLAPYGFHFEPITYKLAPRIIERGCRWRAYLKEHPRVVFQIMGTLEEIPEVASGIGLAILELGRAAVLVDEAHTFLPNRPNRPRGLELLLTGGRERQVDTIMIAQHEIMIAKTLTHASNRFLVASTRSPRELELLAQIYEDMPLEKIEQAGIAFSPDDLHSGYVSVKAVLRNLPKFHFLYLNTDTGEQEILDATQLAVSV